MGEGRCRDPPDCGAPSKPLEPPTPLAGRIRTGAGGLSNDAGPWRWFGLAEFDLIHLARTGQREVATARLDDALRAQVKILRVFATAERLFMLTPTMVGYDDALRWLLGEMTARGIYMEFSVFQDAQLLYPTNAGREQVLRTLLASYKAEPGIVWALANEPSFNGWDSATDPDLLALAEILAAQLGHRDFLIGDPPDGDNEDASAETIAESKELARHCNLLCLHSSRKGGAAPDGNSRLRRWIDHLEGAADIVSACKGSNPTVYLVHNEPMGHASQRFVPIGGGRTYEREYDPDCAIAAGLTAIFSGLGYTYHRIAAQDPGTPGLEELGSLLAEIPVGSPWAYRNDGWNGSPTNGFTWQGKVRHWTNGQQAHSLAYGLDRVGTETWVNGYRVTSTRYASPPNESGDLARSKVAVYEASK